MAENYIFMTASQVLNMGFYLLVYPFLIRTLGTESYGLYALAWSIVALFSTVVSFGFDLPAAGRVAQAREDKSAIALLLSRVQSAKLLLAVGLAALYGVCMVTIPLMRSHTALFTIVYLETLSGIFFPQWYFQGLQRMGVVTAIQLGIKLLSLPFLLLLIHGEEDVCRLAVIMVGSDLLMSLVSQMIIRYRDGIRVGMVIRGIRGCYQEAFPFFLSNAMGIIKERGIMVVIGACLSLTDVALFDLANKIVWIPRTLLMKLNDAMYPKMITEQNRKRIRRILWSEIVLGIVVVAVMIVLGKWCVLLLGGPAMEGAYGVTVVLSSTVLCWMVATAVIEFIFIPTGNRYLVTINQMVALFSAAVMALVGWLWCPTVLFMAGAIACSGMCEMIYCLGISKRKRLL